MLGIGDGRSVAGRGASDFDSGRRAVESHETFDAAARSADLSGQDGGHDPHRFLRRLSVDQRGERPHGRRNGVLRRDVREIDRQIAGYIACIEGDGRFFGQGHRHAALLVFGR